MKLALSRKKNQLHEKHFLQQLKIESHIATLSYGNNPFKREI